MRSGLDPDSVGGVGGGLSLGTQFTPHFGGYGSYGRVLAKKGDAKEWMVRYQFIYSF